MKSINRMILLSCLFYILLSIFTGLYLLNRTKDTANRIYKVEINRIIHHLEASKGEALLTNLPKDLQLRFVKRTDFLSDMDKSPEKIEHFYAESNYSSEYLPLILDDTYLGMLRFDYEVSSDGLISDIIMAELLLFLLFSFLLGVLLYVKQKILMPFNRLSALPGELSKGHFMTDIKEDKSKFFSGFLRNLGLLKDSLLASKKRELNLQREKKQLLLSLSHDIKTPLNAIKLYARAIEVDAYQTKDACIEASKRIGEKTRDIERYIEEIIHHAREDVVDIRVENGEFYLEDLISNIRNTYQDICKRSSISFKIISDRNRLIQGDLDRSIEVLENIMENAIKYGDGRQITLHTYMEEAHQLIRITNTGTPVSENEINHLFESFYRGSGSIGKAGNGLGLYIARTIMQKMRGHIYSEIIDDGMSFVMVFTVQ